MNKLQKLFKLEDETWSLNSISFCLKEDLERFRKGKLLKGDIKVGQYFEWEPDKPNAAEACMVTKITNEKIFTIGNRFGDKEVGNDISRFSENIFLASLSGSSSYTAHKKCRLWTL